MQELERGTMLWKFCLSPEPPQDAIFTYGSDDQKYGCRDWPRSQDVSGYEPDFGSNPRASLQNKAAGSGYLLMVPRCGSPTARLPMLPWSGRTRRNDQGFLVEKGTPGFSAPR
jgi:hypothetical protein